MEKKNTGFVAVNNITASESYLERMEELFKSREGAIDNFPGFRNLRVLKPLKSGGEYLVISEWDSEDDFITWTQSEAFRKGHQRAFADLEKWKSENKPEPMKSHFKTYEILTR